MAKCEICGKGPQFGNMRSFSMRATRRKFNPNVQPIKMKGKDGQNRRVMACTKCIKTMAKEK
jgi:large subunit ribosomal protein L28